MCHGVTHLPNCESREVITSVKLTFVRNAGFSRLKAIDSILKTRENFILAIHEFPSRNHVRNEKIPRAILKARVFPIEVRRKL